jgi:hypothetical protein
MSSLYGRMCLLNHGRIVAPKSPTPNFCILLPTSHFFEKKVKDTKSEIFWVVTPSGSESVDVSEEHIASVFSVEE